MTKSLRSMSKSERRRAISRRLQSKNQTRGLGWWAAHDAREKYGYGDADDELPNADRTTPKQKEQSNAS